MGYNGTENFRAGKRFGFFPAFSLGWVLSEENFFPKNNAVSFIKIRGSYGEVGNDKIGGNVFFIVQQLTSSIQRVVTTTTTVHIGSVPSGKTILYTPLLQKEKSGILI